MKRNWTPSATLVCAMLAMAALPRVQALAQEHPEHPKSGSAPKAEHPEHPEHPEHAEHPEATHAAPTIDQVAKFIRKHVTQAAAGEGGVLAIMDKKAGVERELKLSKVHRERLAKTGEGVYFVCADFTDRTGKIFDLDFWVENSGEGLRVSDTMIHKEAGKARYNWMEKDGVWSKQPIE